MTTFDAELKDVRTALLGLVDVVERLMGLEPRTAEIRKRLRSYRRAYPFPPGMAEDVRDRIEELTAERTKELSP